MTRTKRAAEVSAENVCPFAPEHTLVDSRLKQPTLIIASFGAIMTVIDGTILTVALRAIRDDLGFSSASIVWIVNAYLLCYAGFRLLSGRLCDLFGTRKVFLIGTMLFTSASTICALAHTQTLLVVARALQGVGGAAITAAALSLTVTLIDEQAGRAKAISFLGFAASSGGVIGLMLGGFLTQVLNWRWIFLINLPIGAAIYVAGVKYLPRAHGRAICGPLDVKGAILMFALPTVVVYAIGNADETGWYSLQTLMLMGCAVILSMIFVKIEARTHAPIMPPYIFRRPNLIACVLIALLLAAAGSAGIITSLYLQLVLGRSPLQVSLILLPSTLIITPLSLGLSSKAVIHLGVKPPLTMGLLTLALGLILLTQTSVGGNAWAQVIPGTILTGVGGGIAFTPLTLAAVGPGRANDSGLVSAIMGTAAIFGSTLGLALLSAVSAARTAIELNSGTSVSAALNSGYHVAFLIGSVLASSAAIVGALLLRLDTTRIAFSEGSAL